MIYTPYIFTAYTGTASLTSSLPIKSANTPPDARMRRHEAPSKSSTSIVAAVTAPRNVPRRASTTSSRAESGKDAFYNGGILASLSLDDENDGATTENTAVLGEWSTKMTSKINQNHIASKNDSTCVGSSIDSNIQKRFHNTIRKRSIDTTSIALNYAKENRIAYRKATTCIDSSDDSTNSDNDSVDVDDDSGSISRQHKKDEDDLVDTDDEAKDNSHDSENTEVESEHSEVDDDDEEEAEVGDSEDEYESDYDPNNDSEAIGSIDENNTTAEDDDDNVSFFDPDADEICPAVLQQRLIQSTPATKTTVHATKPSISKRTTSTSTSACNKVATAPVSVDIMSNTVSNSDSMAAGVTSRAQNASIVTKHSKAKSKVNQQITKSDAPIHVQVVDMNAMSTEATAVLLTAEDDTDDDFDDDDEVMAEIVTNNADDTTNNSNDFVFNQASTSPQASCEDQDCDVPITPRHMNAMDIDEVSTDVSPQGERHHAADEISSRTSTESPPLSVSVTPKRNLDYMHSDTVELLSAFQNSVSLEKDIDIPFIDKNDSGADMKQLRSVHDSPNDEATNVADETSCRTVQLLAADQHHPTENRETAINEKVTGNFRRDGSIRRGQWKLGAKIGIGAFGVVHVGMNTKTGTLMAVKSLKMEPSTMKDAEQEIQLLKTLHHENIVRYLGAERNSKYLHIFQEWVPAGSVTIMLSKFGPFPLTVVRNYFCQILHGLHYLHTNHIMHRDLKGSNILVNDDGIVKLADFGASKRFVQLKQDMMMSLTMRGSK
jgi:Protein kinase domain